MPPDAYEQAPAGPDSLICEDCGHTLARVVLCGAQDRCQGGKYEKHFHCLKQGGCGEACGDLGLCKPKEK